jgi:hypothetical protein
MCSINIALYKVNCKLNLYFVFLNRGPNHFKYLRKLYMSRKSKLVYLNAIKNRYKNSSTLEKQKILDEFCKICCYKSMPYKV